MVVMLSGAVFWGMNAITTKMLFRDDGFTTTGLLAARGLWTAPFFALLAWFARPPEFARSWKTAWRQLLLLGFFYGPLACGGLILGAAYTSGAHVSLLLSLSPPATAVVGGILLRERVDRIRIFALGLGLIGASLLAFSHSSAGSSPFGDLLMLIQVTGFTGLFIITRRLGVHYNPLFLTGIYGTLGMIGITLIGIVTGGAAEIHRPFQDWSTASWFFGEIVFGLSIYGQFAQTYALRTLSAGTVSIIASYGSLFVGLVGAAIFLHESFSPTLMTAGAILALALTLAVLPARTFRASR